MSIRVLVVEDDAVAAEAHAAYIERTRGFTLAGVAQSFQDAVRLLGEHEIDLVLLDLHLPDGSGLDLLRQLRATAYPCDVIAVTSARDLEVVRRAVSQGIAAYVLKPFTYSMLESKLRQYATFRAEVERDAGAVSQADVDSMLGMLHSTQGPSVLPKGLSSETLDDVRGALTQAEGMTATEVAELIGSSRVTARRYLEHLADDGVLERRTRFGGTGRPHVEYVVKRPTD
jgi:response regulator of citrate/malate metabolism